MPAPATFRSLRIRNYRLYFVGQIISVCGTWMQTIAQGWLVLRLSGNSGVALGTVTALQYLPLLLFGLWGGLLADRVDKRRLLIFTQSVLGVAAATLAALDLAGVIELWMVYSLVIFTGLATAADQPSRLSFVPEMVGPDDLPNALGLNSAVFNGARIIGPTIAGFLIVASGTGACFVVNALSYFATIVALARMRPTDLRRGEPAPRGRGQIREGALYAWRTPLLRANLLLMSVVSLLGFNFPVVLPLMAKLVFERGPGAYGLLAAAQGAGALVGALVLASMHRTDGRRLVLAVAAFGFAMCIASVAPTLSVLAALMSLVGVGNIISASSSNAMIQLDSAPPLRGRVTSIRTMTVLGSTPIGATIAGWVSETAGPRWAMAMGGVASLGAAAVFGPILLRDTGGTRLAIEDVLETEAAVAKE